MNIQSESSGRPCDDAKKSLTSTYSLRMGLKKDQKSLFNQDNKNNINIRLYNSTVKSGGLPLLTEVNLPVLTMNAYQKKNPAAITSAPSAGERKKATSGKKSSNALKEEKITPNRLEIKPLP